MMTKIIARITFILVVAEVLLILLSWLFSATVVDSVRPLLSSEGLRWMLGQCTSTLLHPILIYLILLAMAAGSLLCSGLCKPQTDSGRRPFAMRISLGLLLMMIILIIVVVLLPGGILLSATGHLWPSPFSRSLFPLFSLFTVMTSSCYGLLSHQFRSLTDVFRALSWGIEKAAPFIVVYLVAAFFVRSCLYVFV